MNGHRDQLKVEKRFRLILSRVLGIDQEAVDSRLTADSVDQWDSLKQMNIIAALEEEFNIRFSETESFLHMAYQPLLDNLSEKLNSVGD